LFNWDDDIEVLIGSKPFEFRITTMEMVAGCHWAQAWAVDDLKTTVKSEIVQRRKSWIEKWFSWWRHEE
jgi:hypothetical protein